MSLSDEQMAELLSHRLDRAAMLNAAYRMGMLRAAEVCDDVYHDIAYNDDAGDVERAQGVAMAMDAIRAEADATPQAKEG